MCVSFDQKDEISYTKPIEQSSYSYKNEDPTPVDAVKVTQFDEN